MTEKTPLQTWLTDNDVKVADLAKRVGCSDVHIYRICNDDPRVSSDLAVRIFKETGVRVGPLKNASHEEAETVAKVLGPDEARP